MLPTVQDFLGRVLDAFPGQSPTPDQPWLTISSLVLHVPDEAVEGRHLLGVRPRLDLGGHRALVGEVTLTAGCRRLVG